MNRLATPQVYTYINKQIDTPVRTGKSVWTVVPIIVLLKAANDTTAIHESLLCCCFVYLAIDAGERVKTAMDTVSSTRAMFIL